MQSSTLTAPSVPLAITTHEVYALEPVRARRLCLRARFAGWCVRVGSNSVCNESFARSGNVHYLHHPSKRSRHGSGMELAPVPGSVLTAFVELYGLGGRTRTGGLRLPRPALYATELHPDWWRGRELNPRPPGYEPGDLPLIYPASSNSPHPWRTPVSPAFAVGAALWKCAGLSLIIEEYTANAPLEGLPMRLARPMADLRMLHTSTKQPAQPVAVPVEDIAFLEFVPYLRATSAGKSPNRPR